MNKEQKTILEIQKAVPDIMELKEGCRIEIEGQANMCLGEDIFRNLETAELDEYSFITADKNENWYKIIGRPITFLDIKKVFKQNNDFGSCNLVLNIWDMWNDEDDFTKQSKETKDLIGDLILK